MGFLERLDDKLIEFIRRQQMFFTASAPSSGGRINVSPKGIDALHVIDPETVCYLDLTGSGNETAAHVKENGRLTIMLCAFEGAPLILRLYGTGRSVYPGASEWADLSAHFPQREGTRQIIVLDIESVQTSCGFGVPRYEYVDQRETLVRWGEQKGEEGVRAYWAEHNVTSIDGLPTGPADLSVRPKPNPPVPWAGTASFWSISDRRPIRSLAPARPPR